MSNNENPTQEHIGQTVSIHVSNSTESTFIDLPQPIYNKDLNNTKSKNHLNNTKQLVENSVVETVLRNPYYKLSKELISKKYSSEEEKTCEKNDETTTKKRRKRRSYYEILKDNSEKGFDTTLTHYKKVKLYNHELNSNPKNSESANYLPTELVSLQQFKNSNDKNVQKPIPIFKNKIKIIMDQNPEINLMDGNLLWEYANNMHNINLSNNVLLNNDNDHQVNNYIIINPQIVLNNNKN